MPTTTETIPEWKREEVEALRALLDDASTVGIVSVTGIPSRQLQDMRRELHGHTDLRISRNTLIRRALEAVDEGLEGLAEHVEGPVGLVVTEANPFSLYRRLELTKTPAPIGAGEVAPNDIVIEAGDTGIDPGPFVGDLQNVGVPARIDEGSIKVMETTTVLEAGEEVSLGLASVLNELDLEPKEVGLDLRAVFADGIVFDAADLAIDVDAYRDDVATAVGRARGLAIGAAFPASGVVDALLARANAQGRRLAVEAGFLEVDTAGDVLGAATAGGRALAVAIGEPDVAPTPETPATTTADEAASDADDESDETETADDEAESDEDDAADAAGLGDLFG
ncbi:MAG: 50S ribosomal protein L10 [Halobacteriales archaeon]